MAKPEWGTKRTCRDCGARFYDLKRKPITCPSCQAVHAGDRAAKPRRTPAPAAKPAAAAAKPAAAAVAAEKTEAAEEPPVAAKEMKKTEDPVDSDIDNPDAAEKADTVVDGDSNGNNPMEISLQLDDDDI